ncbi:MAG: hypothetical protein SF162_11300 [bacterium]|nr:hypothetical protein [bacterium]
MGYSPMERAEAFLRAGELHDALDALSEQIAAIPDDQAAYRLRIGILLRLAHQEPDQHDSHLQAAAADLTHLEPLMVEDLIHQYQVVQRLQGADAAHQLLIDRYTGSSPGDPAHDPRWVELLLESLYQRGDSATAINLLFDLPKTWRWLRWNGDFHALKGDDRVALDYYCSALDTLDETAQDSAPKAAGFIGNLRAQLLIRRAAMYERLGLYAEAEIDLAEAESLLPADPMIRFRRGLMLFLSGQPDSAFALCRAALEDERQPALREAMIDLVREEARYAAVRAALGV